jgi:lipopolysaccharide/colanic/teichoic acid biosynthesis glycosyltransferase
MCKRIFDIFWSFIGLIFLLPLMLIVAIIIKLTSKGPILYSGNRVGKEEKEFKCHKFRTMKLNSDTISITVGDKDPRVTSIGLIIRKLNIDELPQLWNVLKGEMTFVGPRPDTPKYAEYYKNQFKDYFKFKPGITSPSSIYFADESELYVGKDDPEKIYIEETIPKKVELDKVYFENVSILNDFKYIFITLFRIVKR